MRDEIDRLLKEKLGDGVSNLRLPEGCAARLVGRVRSRRRMMRVRWTVICILLVAGLFSLCGFFRSPECVAGARTILVAGDAQPTQEVQSGWAFLGIFSECFRRTKLGKRKEED